MWFLLVIYIIMGVGVAGLFKEVDNMYSSTLVDEVLFILVWPLVVLLCGCYVVYLKTIGE